MMTVAQLNSIRDRVRKELLIREPHNRLVVGVGTVGIAAGAREIMAAAMEVVNTLGLDMVVVGEDLSVPAEQMPVVRFIGADGEEITFTSVTASKIREIVKDLADKVGTAENA